MTTEVIEESDEHLIERVERAYDQAGQVIAQVTDRLNELLDDRQTTVLAAALYQIVGSTPISVDASYIHPEWPSLKTTVTVAVIQKEDRYDITFDAKVVDESSVGES